MSSNIAADCKNCGLLERKVNIWSVVKRSARGFEFERVYFHQQLSFVKEMNRMVKVCNDREAMIYITILIANATHRIAVVSAGSTDIIASLHVIYSHVIY